MDRLPGLLLVVAFAAAIAAGCITVTDPPEVRSARLSGGPEAGAGPPAEARDAAALERWAIANPDNPDRTEALVRAARIDLLGGPVPGRPESADPRPWIDKYVFGGGVPRPRGPEERVYLEREFHPLVEEALRAEGDPELVSAFVVANPLSPVAFGLAAFEASLRAGEGESGPSLSLSDSDLAGLPELPAADPQGQPRPAPVRPPSGSGGTAAYQMTPGVLEIRIGRQAHNNGWTRVDYEVTNKSRHQIRNWAAEIEPRTLGTQFPAQAVVGRGLAPRETASATFHVRNERRFLNLTFRGEVTDVMVTTDDGPLQARDYFRLQVR